VVPSETHRRQKKIKKKSEWIQDMNAARSAVPKPHNPLKAPPWLYTMLIIGAYQFGDFFRLRCVRVGLAFERFWPEKTSWASSKEYAPLKPRFRCDKR